jgi:hypothetical protein
MSKHADFVVYYGSANVQEKQSVADLSELEHVEIQLINP